MKRFFARNRWYIALNIFSVAVIFACYWSFVRPTPLPEPVTYAEVAEARELGLAWLATNYEDGIFRYEFDPEISQTPRSSNALRQLMASRVAASEAGEDDAFLEIHTDNIQFVLDEWYQEDENGGYVLYKDKSKLGANAMLLRSLSYSPDFESYKAEAAATAAGIVELQNEDGSFMPWYVEPGYEYDGDYLLNFYSGEAILALVEYYEVSGDPDILDAAKRSGEFYLGHYVDRIDENYHPAYVPWHTMAYSKLYSLTRDERYAQAIFTLNDRLLVLLDLEIHPGRFYQHELAHEGQQAPHASSDAVYIEGMLWAYELAVQLGERERAGRYEEAIKLAATRLIDLQYQEREADFRAALGTYLGAIPIRETKPAIRVDTTQHALDAFEKYLAVFSHESE